MEAFITNLSSYLDGLKQYSKLVEKLVSSFKLLEFICGIKPDT